MRYQTNQRKVLFSVLEQHRDRALSAEQILSLLGENASRSAVYRNLSLLENEGLIQRLAAPGSKKTLYRYTGSGDCKNHLHLECAKCGKTYHLKASSTDSLISDVMEDAGFQIDRSSTVLHGICENCRKN